MEESSRPLDPLKMSSLEARNTLREWPQIAFYHYFPVSVAHYREVDRIVKHDQRTPGFQPPKLTNLG